MIHRIGNDFNNSIHLNLLPGITLAKGYWRVQIQFVTDDKSNTTYNFGEHNCYGDAKDFDVIVGQDVRDISFMVHRHNSYPGNPNTFIKYSMRVDRILLLNFVHQLVGTTLKIKNL